MDQTDPTLANKQEVDSFLNDIEKAELQKFADNSTLIQAVEKVLLAPAYMQGSMKAGEEARPGLNFALGLAWSADKSDISNEVIGRDIRAKTEGIKLMVTAMKVLRLYQSADVKPDKKPNQAR